MFSSTSGNIFHMYDYFETGSPNKAQTGLKHTIHWHFHTLTTEIMLE